MKRYITGLALIFSATIGRAADAPAQAHLDAARAAAGTQWANRVESFCRASATPKPPRGPLPVTLPEVPDWPEPPARIFDNVYFVGSKGVSSFAIVTSEGIIITDAMWAYDVEKSVAGGLKTLGLDPAKIRYVIIPHGHPDHYGGAQFLHDRFGAKIVAPKGDLDLISSGPAHDTTPIPKAYDLIVGDGDTLTLGETTVTFSVVPGHTAGGVVLSFPVTSKGVAHRMLIWAAGGSTPGKPAGQQQQAEALQRLIGLAQSTGMDALADNHGSHILVEAMRAHPQAGNPFLIGNKSLIAYLTMRQQCNLARLADTGAATSNAAATSQ
ncbi:MBL fold metallo-hydrolase [Duganella sp. FT94W]|uniref:MBL fold metallo-hydrolase n=1 Tax=Duganella lactea TaxID=2692173 RepID=A0ABW9V5Z7_9BURK|nr:MBL fold metallo-hydrolase [Duganella lactea]MYM34366.1 MBL fold metallo-hydrolase [Duganella lactea]